MDAWLAMHMNLVVMALTEYAVVHQLNYQDKLRRPARERRMQQREDAAKHDDGDQKVNTSRLEREFL